MCLSFVELVQVVTQIVTATTAVVMAILAYRAYLLTPEQEPEEEKESTGIVDDERILEILIYSTSKQKTRLKITDKGLECHLDDTREGKGGHQWTLTKAQVSKILSNQAYSVNPGYKARVGTINIGTRHGWLYSKSLFPEPEYLKSEIKWLLESVNS